LLVFSCHGQVSDLVRVCWLFFCFDCLCVAARVWLCASGVVGVPWSSVVVVWRQFWSLCLDRVSGFFLSKNELGILPQYALFVNTTPQTDFKQLTMSLVWTCYVFHVCLAKWYHVPRVGHQHFVGLVISFYKVCPGNRRRRVLAVGVYRDLEPGGPVDRALRNARRGVTGGRSSRRRCLCDGPWPHLRVWRVSVCCVVGLVCRGGCGRLGLLS
jgi:hypothetical protein